MKQSYSVEPIQNKDTYPFLLNIHYAGRIPSITYSFGLFLNTALVGCVTYGTPPSSGLRIGIAGREFSSNVLELNRLCLLKNIKNEASLLVGASLKELKKQGNFIVVSFADTKMDHTGYVYQACNFLYTGLSAKRTDWKVRGKEHLHGQTIADEFRGCKNRAAMMREKYGEDFYLAPRSRKHRYIYIIGDRNFKKSVLGSIKYKLETYPKSNCKEILDSSRL